MTYESLLKLAREGKTIYVKLKGFRVIVLPAPFGLLISALCRRALPELVAIPRHDVDDAVLPSPLEHGPDRLDVPAQKASSGVAIGSVKALRVVSGLSAAGGGR